MVKLRFIIKDGMLVLRISEKKERYYKSVKHLLIGQPNLKYWMKEHERFSSHAPSCAKNNQILEDFKKIYTDLVLKYPDLSARQIAIFHKPNNKFHILPQIEKQDHYINSVETYLIMVIEQEKLKCNSGNYRIYEKLLDKCRKLIADFSYLSFQSINFEYCVYLSEILSKHPGYAATSRAFRSLIGKAHKDNRVKFDLNQIRDFDFKRFNPNAYHNLKKKPPQVLSHIQIREFLNLDLKNITPQYKNRKTVELYYDFCVFMFYSFCSPCDVVKMKHSDIMTGQILCYIRKKTMKLVQLPIPAQIMALINKYKLDANQEYIFPIMDDKKSTQSYYSFCNYFIQKVNCWLKDLARNLNWDLELRSYIFRHTAITLAVDGGLNTSYISMLTGSNPKCIQDNYYNGMNEKNTRKLYQIFEDALV